MEFVRPFKTSKRLAFLAAIFSLMVLAGCDEYVRIIRDPDVRIPNNATWAWRPAMEERAAAREARDSRPITSRDVLSRDQRNEGRRREGNADDAVDRQRVKTAIEQALMAKGFKQVGDPAAADFLVDYKFGVNRRTETVPVTYGAPYPGLVCGPFRCWESWGYGPAFVGYENIRFRAGTIVFDWMQKANRHLVYRAIGEKPVRYDAFSLSQNDINGLVHHLLKDLKPGK